MTADKPREDNWGETLFNVRRSIRYHMKRERFFKAFHRGVGFGTAVAGSLAVVALLPDDPSSGIALFFSASIAIAQFADLYFEPEAAARLHEKIKQDFCGLEERLIEVSESAQTEELLRRIQADRAKIEREEPPVFEALEDICYNEQCFADGWSLDARDSDGKRIYKDIPDWKLKLLSRLNLA